jgi:HlyD family secretion protein
MLRNGFQIVIVLVIAVAASACDGPDVASAGWQRSQDKLPAVEAIEVRLGSLPLEERMSGSVRARNQTEILAEVSGTIERVFVDDGDRVEVGEPLVQLRSRDFEERVRQAEAGLQVAEARVRQAEAHLARAQADLDRIQTIVEQQLGTQAELDAAIADSLSAEADLDLMNAQRDQAASLLEEREAELADTLVRAPIDGVVGARNAEVGQQAATSTPLFVIGDVDSMQVEVTLTQRMLGYIDVGTPVHIYSDISPEDVIEAAITRVSPYLHPVTHTTRAEIHIDQTEQQLRPGMFVTVDVLYGRSDQAPLVPNSALYRHPRDGREGLFVADLDEALADPELEVDSMPNSPVPTGEPVGPVSVEFVPVQVVARGRVSSGVSGVQPGDWVVTIGHNLLDNQDEQLALVQTTPWEHILELQQMQSSDLLDIIRAKQEQNQALNLSLN